MATLFTTETPAAPNVSDSTQYSLGVEWVSDAGGTWTGIRVFTPTTQPGATYQVVAYHLTSQTTGTEIARGSATWVAGGQWLEIPFAIPAAIVAGEHYVAAYVTVDWFVLTVNGLSVGVTNGHLTAFPSNTASALNGRIHVGGDALPEQESVNKANYFADPIVSFSLDVAVTAAAETDSAFHVVGRKSRAIAASSETDAAIALGRRKARAVGLGIESDAAQQLRGVKRLALGMAVETDLALPIARTPGGKFVVRPNLGSVTRPGSGLVVRPNTGTVTRP